LQFAEIIRRGAGGRPQSSSGGIADVIWRERNEKSSVFAGTCPAGAGALYRARKSGCAVFDISWFCGQTFSSCSPGKINASARGASMPTSC